MALSLGDCSMVAVAENGNEKGGRQLIEGKICNRFSVS